MAEPDLIGNATSEPSLAEVLSDPIVQALMRADRVSVSEVLAVLMHARERTAGYMHTANHRFARHRQLPSERGADVERARAVRKARTAS